MGVGGVIFSGKKRYKGVRYNIISITRGWVGVQFPGKKHNVTLEWPLIVKVGTLGSATDTFNVLTSAAAWYQVLARIVMPNNVCVSPTPCYIGNTQRGVSVLVLGGEIITNQTPKTPESVATVTLRFI